MGVVCPALLGGHRQILQFLLHLLKSRCAGVLLDLASLQVGHPLVEGRLRYLVVDVHPHKVILREDLARKMRHDNPVLLRVHQKVRARVDPLEPRLAVVHIVVTPAVVAVEDADRVHFLDLVILLPDVDVLRDRLARPVEDPLQVIQLTRELHLHDYQVPPAVLRLDVNAVELVRVRVLVRLAFQKLDDLHVLP